MNARLIVSIIVFVLFFLFLKAFEATGAFFMSLVASLFLYWLLNPDRLRRSIEKEKKQKERRHEDEKIRRRAELEEEGKQRARRRY